jgi:hypothetical protein
MKTFAVILSLAISGIAISSAYTEAYASRMNGKGMDCSEGTNRMSARYKMATEKPKWPSPSKTGINSILRPHGWRPLSFGIG